MKVKLFYVILILSSALAMYGFITGNIQNNYKNKREGGIFLSLIKNKFKGEIYSIDLFKYFEIKIYIHGVANVDFLIEHGYVKRKKYLFCKNGNAVFIVYLEKDTLLKYSYNVEICQ
ncbi:hypothetical protein FIA56_11865 [Testudinibacter sp. TR-2022]|uniref:hypothetical protein n=1 Tax=Testudinibacter sp. TR-2022 TaxID=2585029 RepID=UPI00111BA6FB|nr:hypothetical protein [Testudinibacter sp. TR-2022]TNH00339.1 hypothetical protein FHQ22_12155 [Pasteurellaceae bacterium Phil31]TNH10875.1 hypothetical protein FIA56_11865 [Testudinibacter sp. TR-2022]TNH13143.1 hypothetical protein FHQ23_12245 [Testudinibacter sp. TR-2022]